MWNTLLIAKSYCVVAAAAASEQLLLWAFAFLLLRVDIPHKPQVCMTQKAMQYSGKNIYYVAINKRTLRSQTLPALW